MGSILMTFAGLTSGYFVSRSSLLADNQWLQFALPEQFYWATAVIIISTITLVWAQISAKKNNQTGVKVGVLVTFFLGLAFALLQWLGWEDLLNRGLFFTGESSNTAVSWVYVITGLHWLHVVAGIIVLAVTSVRALKGAYTSADYMGLSMTGIFWHFLDVLWIYLFCFLVFIR